MDIGTGLRLDPDYIGGGTIALLAKKGAGKTYTARVMAEEMWAAGVPFAFIDPMGAAWGLRSSADGKGEGIPVAIFGGSHGDAPLERGAGALMADLLVDEGISMVLDMSELGSRAAERQFAFDFLERLYRRNSALVHLLMDEADLFAPQKPQAGDQKLLGVTENIVRRGRNRGIGITLITQRPAVLNKDVLTQVDALVALRMTGLTDRKAIDEWVKGHGDDEAARLVKESLSSLKNGESWWWIPEKHILKRVQVREARTFDSSPTRTRGSERREPTSYADIDMEVIGDRMAATIERAKLTDPKELAKRIRELEAELAKRPTEVEVVKEVEVEVVKEVAPPEFESGLADLVHDFEVGIGNLRKHIADFASVPSHSVESTRGKRMGVGVPSVIKQPSPRRPAAPTNGAVNGSGTVETPAQQRIVDALAWFEAIGVATPSRAALAPMAGTKPSSGGFKNNLGRLRSNGAIDYPQGGTVQLTDSGRGAANQPDVAPTPEQLQAAVMERITPAQARILECLIHAYPSEVAREDLANAVGVTVTSGGFKNNLGAMRTLELIDYPTGGYVVACDLLFP